MDQEESFAEQLAEDKAKTKPEATKTEKITGLFGTLMHNPLVQILVPSLTDLGTGGLAPGWTGIVVWAYFSEKASGKTPNIAEFLIVGIPAITVDAIELLNLTGVLYFLTLGITIPCMLGLWIWRFYKHINKKSAPIKPKKS